MSLSPAASAAIAGFIVGLTVCGALSAATPIPAPVPNSLSLHSLRLVDARGHTTAFIGNVADGASPAILLYDHSGVLRSAMMVDSVTGETVPMSTPTADLQSRTSTDLRVKGLVQHKGPRHI